ncbi:protein FANTASTIC FOUR 3-like [Solanum dulcamara]|uniref:protein FANTASTIC FOUR 3-like n=1 Tax=Solanum dulcamara TaxID=45834 RepID=UPI0024853B65|nr:protein FANTASTIC FOUR 3-like [Solanum dulcamara]
MSTIVYQDFQSCSDSHIIKTTTFKLKLPTPTTIVENITTTNEKCWSSLRNLSTNYSKENENSYVHPLSSSRLSEKSLALCTENLGSETGTDQTIDTNIFSFSSRQFKAEQSNYNKVMTTESCRKIPPPLTTLRGSNSIQFRPHREGGRLVIKAFEAPKVRTYFHAERSNGRLRLCFLNDETSVSKFDLSEMEMEMEMETIDEEDGELEVESDVFEREINDKEEEEEREDEEENDISMKRDMDGNSYDVEAEIGIVNCQRVRRCNEERQGKKTFCDWRNPLWVATS